MYTNIQYSRGMFYEKSKLLVPLDSYAKYNIPLASTNVMK